MRSHYLTGVLGIPKPDHKCTSLLKQSCFHFRCDHFIAYIKLPALFVVAIEAAQLVVMVYLLAGRMATLDKMGAMLEVVPAAFAVAKIQAVEAI
jgi:hypothetical protein